MSSWPGRIRSGVLAVAVATLAVWFGLRLIDIYAGPWESFARPARAFLDAFAAGDSLQLRRLTRSDTTVRRALALVGRSKAPAGRRLEVWAGERFGDTTRLTYHGEPCLLVVTFLGSGRRARVIDFSVPCRP